MRAVSIPIADVSGVAGLIQPRSLVDVLFTRPGSMAGCNDHSRIEDAVVLLHRPQHRSGPRRRSTGRPARRPPLPTSVSPRPALSPFWLRRRMPARWNSPRIRDVSAWRCAIRSTSRASRTIRPSRRGVGSAALHSRTPASGCGRRAGTAVRDPQAWAALTGR
ncbi:MAG: hypothetical protein IPP47_21475 [Bryobacterales bacterium]|nr:hypothetical protein [Bryobacterales bacterium]